MTNKKGSLVVETTIFLPVFLVALLALACLSRLIATEEGILHSLLEESERLAAGAFLSDTEILPETAEDLLTRFAFSESVLSRIRAEQGDRVEGLRIKEFQYLYMEDGQEDLIRLSVTCKGRIPLPLDFPKNTTLESNLLLRGFTGAPAANPAAGFAVFREDRGSSLVYVFPRAGERFHEAGCVIIEVSAEERILTDSLRRQYAPCSHCEPQSLLVGNRVYCFPRAGETYHRRSCYQVDRYVAEMTAREAVDQGYSPCQICGGGLRSEP
ncbi:MAG: hypothetical protein IJO79_05505 [Firmicutes bacterium]|nr:hypothetical protein [Bacillota bacterium]